MYLTVPCSLHNRSVEWLADPGQEEELEGAQPAGDWSSVADSGSLSRIRLFSIPDPNCLHPSSRIRIKEFKYFNPKKTKKWFLSSGKYDPGCSSRIPDPYADFLPIPDPGSRGQKGTGSWIRIRNTGHHSDADPQHLPCSFGLGCSD